MIVRLVIRNADHRGKWRKKSNNINTVGGVCKVSCCRGARGEDEKEGKERTKDNERREKEQ